MPERSITNIVVIMKRRSPRLIGFGLVSSNSIKISLDMGPNSCTFINVVFETLQNLNEVPPSPKFRNFFV